MSVTVIMGNITGFGTATVTISPASVAANTTAEQTFTVPGVLLSDVCIDITKPTFQAGLGIANFRVSAAGTVAITFSNNTGSPIVPTAAEAYKMTFVRPESTQTGFVA